MLILSQEDSHPRPLSSFLFSAGSYTHSKGIEVVRQHIEAFIEKRDGGIPANREDIYLINGATEGIRVSRSVLVRCTSVIVSVANTPLTDSHRECIQ